jgi:hypothetical protein
MIYKRYNFTVFTTVIKKKKGADVKIKITESTIEVYAQSIKQAKNRLQKMGLNAELKPN